MRSKSLPYLTFHSKIGRDPSLKYAIEAPVNLQIDGEEERKLSAVVGRRRRRKIDCQTRRKGIWVLETGR
ncbi:unnamed protein product [Linum tenue]|uniref:Uncharacterized protein n=1 Tax=Linum tenue TaxID=586396 RepID=A0AAV0Q3N5_9ROSI|nr:unnamed protein product [Linum tenue]